ncbi:hypothetical protein [Streptomyces sp. H39-C1]|uniref:hypothetical protein n=1 Tax=Streptomyces sp. H39-C1 TaxID=3004355 RepID=UPI0022AE9E08|nr:hypothetical protein [Streptomyces sp. H39-C1]MCZ4099828.1 hypothetical protein [Streptomyces sp. H39-C1]
MLITDAAVRETAVTLVQSLGGDWTLDPEAPADGAAHLIYSDGRAISFRPILGGATVQLWITGNAAPALPDSATPAEYAAYEAHMAARLDEGRRYNKAASLVTEEDEEPAVIILRTLEDLLPAFEYKPHYVGHRPWIDLFDNALAAVTAERDTAPAAVPVVDGEGAPEVEPEPVAEAEREPEPVAEVPHEADAELESEPGTQPDPVAEVAPEADAERESDVEAEPERTGEPTPAPDAQSEAGAASEPAQAEKDTGEVEDQPKPAVSPRPRKRAPKRRPKASTN